VWGVQAPQPVFDQPPIRPSAAIFVGLAGTTAGLTLLFLGMRSVMEIGGVCAEGGPFVPVQPCPEGIPLVMFGGVWGGLIFAGLYAWQAFRHGVPNFVALLWSALFLSLGWNFLEFGLDPPGGGPAWGWLVCAVLFGLMGGIPLVLVGPWIVRRFTRSEPPPSWRTTIPTAAVVRAAVSAIPTVRVRPAESTDLVSALERLEALHRSGSLDDTEFEAAKDKLLSREGTA
jgi:hypothetical protein